MADDAEPAQLLENLRRGDEAAWEEAFRQLYPAAFFAAKTPRAYLEEADAEDVAIEALSLLPPKISEVRSVGELKALVVTIASRRAISLRRKLSAEKRGASSTQSLEALQETSPGALAPESRGTELTPAELLELARLLDIVLSEEEPRTRSVLREFILEGVPYSELSAKHSLPIGTVGVVIYRGLARIRARLAKNPRLAKELRLHLRF